MDLFGRLFGQLLERRRRRAQAETVFEHTQDALFLVDVTRDGAFRIRQVNEVYEEITGRSTADIRGKTPTEIVGERQGARLEERCRHCVETREAIDYEDQIRIDAETRHWHTTLAPVVEDDEVVQLVGATRDVTEQRERERTLAARNRAMEKAPVGITISDPDQEDNPLVYVNEEYEDMTGYDEAEVDGRNCRFLQGEGTDPEPSLPCSTRTATCCSSSATSRTSRSASSTRASSRRRTNASTSSSASSATTSGTRWTSPGRA
ncbi:hypothetical protein BRC73_08030 [Halobacteriales archaeon QH_7_66_37]|nr:MAG: hypothetical protein BRC73_08030 [Halobacteriales archaeon QH_7_66_37]